MPKPMDRLFARPKPVIAMIHTGPTPGVPGCTSVECAVERALAEARLYAELGVDGLLVENMHDFPCVHEREMGPEVAAFMTRVAAAVKRNVGRMPVGVQVLFQGNKTALAVALAAGCDFVRAEGWTHAHVSDKGVAQASAGEVLRYRRALGAEHIPVYADVRKKHAAHAWTADLTMAELASAAHLARADGLIVTGSATGHAPDPADLEAVREATPLPLFVGSGLDADNFPAFVHLADGFIIGSAFKENGDWRAPVCETRVRALIGAVEYARGRESAPIR
ncbi:MAG TPA: BtpA/SgcQ family protein [Rubricoccaceae bacterium]|nr:BtpA/SgcQ family protein [Rubricoccaceae bacterium]